MSIWHYFPGYVFTDTIKQVQWVSFSAEPLVVQIGQALPCSGPVNTLMNSPGCIQRHGLAPEAMLSSQD